MTFEDRWLHREAERNGTSYEIEAANRFEWLTTRRKIVTATDASAILGVNPYASALTTWREKQGYDEDTMTAPMYWGLVHEENVAQEFQLEHNAVITKGKLVIHPNQPWAGATLDYLVESCVIAGRQRTDGILEVKTAGFWAGENWGSPFSDEIPKQYVVQAVWQMWVTGRKWCVVYVLVGGNDCRPFLIEWDENAKALLNTVARACKAFYDANMVGGEPPEVSGHDADREIVRSVEETEPGVIVKATPKVNFHARWHKSRKERYEKVKALLAESENVIIQAIGPHSGVKTNIGTFTFKADKNGRRSLRTPYKSNKG